jgi:parallel beta-helix repeat protein
MPSDKKHIRLKEAILVMCVVLCLLLTLTAPFKFSANASSINLVVGPSDSIQTAINVAAIGDTIQVQSGTYNESLLINKTITLIGEDRDNTIINGQNNQFIIDITVNNVALEGFTIQSTLNPADGINISNSQGDLISDNTIENSQKGIELWSSNDNTFSDNVISNNSQGGIVLWASNRNNFSANTISNNSVSLIYGGLYMYLSGGNEFSGNTFANNLAGEQMTVDCFQNIFYHNNFYDTFTIGSSSSTGANLWNFPNPGGEGNYWSNFTGPNRGDGISGTPYFVDKINRDNDPLLGVFSASDATFQGETYQISVISNSTISGFEFEVGTETGNKIILFNATDAEGTDGFCRITIPTAIMKTQPEVLVGDKETLSNWTSSPYSGFYNLNFSYSDSNQEVLIISSETLDLYNQLLANFQALNGMYNQLNGSYTSLLPDIQILQNLTSDYNGLLDNYNNLLGNYTQLQQSYQNLNGSYQQHLTDYNQTLQNVRSLMYIFAAATAVLILVTVYFSKRSYSGPAKVPEERKPILSTPTSSASRT